MKLTPLLADLRALEQRLAAVYRTAAQVHVEERDVHYQSLTFAEQCDRHAEVLAGGGRAETAAPLTGDLLEDLRTLVLLATEVSTTWIVAGQAAQALRDEALLETVRRCHEEAELHVKWLTTRLKDAAPQALVVG
jgi:hypothetical protein